MDKKKLREIIKHLESQGWKESQIIKQLEEKNYPKSLIKEVLPKSVKKNKIKLPKIKPISSDAVKKISLGFIAILLITSIMLIISNLDFTETKQDTKSTSNLDKGTNEFVCNHPNPDICTFREVEFTDNKQKCEDIQDGLLKGICYGKVMETDYCLYMKWAQFPQEEIDKCKAKKAIETKNPKLCYDNLQCLEKLYKEDPTYFNCEYGICNDFYTYQTNKNECLNDTDCTESIAVLYDDINICKNGISEDVKNNCFEELIQSPEECGLYESTESLECLVNFNTTCEETGMDCENLYGKIEPKELERCKNTEYNDVCLLQSANFYKILNICKHIKDQMLKDICIKAADKNNILSEDICNEPKIQEAFKVFNTNYKECITHMNKNIYNDEN